MVVLIIFNPEMGGLALFIDAVGLEAFLMLLEIQLLAITGVFLRTKIKPVFIRLKHLLMSPVLMFSWKEIKEKPESLVLLVPGQATIMQLLVLSCAINIALNLY